MRFRRKARKRVAQVPNSQVEGSGMATTGARRMWYPPWLTLPQRASVGRASEMEKVEGSGESTEGMTHSWEATTSHSAPALRSLVL